MNNIVLMMFEFFKTGLFAMGGGLATIPFLKEMAANYGWFTNETLMTMIAVSESTPGPMGVNMATYIGHSMGGLIGGLLSTLSLVAPSVIIICIIANYYQKFKNAKIVKMIFAGIKPAVVAFILCACLSLFTNVLLNNQEAGLQMINYKSLIFLVLLFIFDYKNKKSHPIMLILIGAFIGIIFRL